MRVEPDPKCDICEGAGKTRTPAYQQGGHIVDEREDDCICTYEDDEDDFDDELISAAEDLGLTPDEAERAVEDYKRI